MGALGGAKGLWGYLSPTGDNKVKKNRPHEAGTTLRIMRANMASRRSQLFSSSRGKTGIILLETRPDAQMVDDAAKDGEKGLHVQFGGGDLVRMQ